MWQLEENYKCVQEASVECIDEEQSSNSKEEDVALNIKIIDDEIV